MIICDWIITKKRLDQQSHQFQANILIGFMEKYPDQNIIFTVDKKTHNSIILNVTLKSIDVRRLKRVLVVKDLAYVSAHSLSKRCRI